RRSSDLIRRRVGDEEVGVAVPAQPERLPQGVRHHPAEALVREGPVEEVAHPDRLARDPDRTAGGTSGEVGRIGVEGVDVGDGEGGGAPARRPVPGGGSVHASRYYLSVTSVRRSAKRHLEVTSTPPPVPFGFLGCTPSPHPCPSPGPRAPEERT